MPRKVTAAAAGAAGAGAGAAAADIDLETLWNLPAASIFRSLSGNQIKNLQESEDTIHDFSIFPPIMSIVDPKIVHILCNYKGFTNDALARLDFSHFLQAILFQGSVPNMQGEPCLLGMTALEFGYKPTVPNSEGKMIKLATFTPSKAELFAYNIYSDIAVIENHLKSMPYIGLNVDLHMLENFRGKNTDLSYFKSGDINDVMIFNEANSPTAFTNPPYNIPFKALKPFIGSNLERLGAAAMVAFKGRWMAQTTAIKKRLSNMLLQWFFNEPFDDSHPYAEPVLIYTDAGQFLGNALFADNPNTVNAISQATIIDSATAGLAPTDQIKFVSNKFNPDGTESNDLYLDMNLFSHNLSNGTYRILYRNNGMTQATPYKISIVVQILVHHKWIDVATVPFSPDTSPIVYKSGPSIDILGNSYALATSNKTAIDIRKETLLANETFQRNYIRIFTEQPDMVPPAPLVATDQNMYSKIYITVLLTYLSLYSGVWVENGVEADVIAAQTVIFTYQDVQNNPQKIKFCLDMIKNGTFPYMAKFQKSSRGRSGGGKMVGGAGETTIQLLNTAYGPDTHEIIFDKFLKETLFNYGLSKSINFVSQLSQSLNGLQILFTCPEILLDIKRLGDAGQLIVAYIRHLRGEKVIFITIDANLITLALQLGMNVIRQWPTEGKANLYRGRRPGRVGPLWTWGRSPPSLIADHAYIELEPNNAIDIATGADATSKISINGPTEEYNKLLDSGGLRTIETKVIPAESTARVAISDETDIRVAPTNIGYGGGLSTFNKDNDIDDSDFNITRDLCKFVKPYVETNIIYSDDVLLRMAFRYFKRVLNQLFVKQNNGISRVDLSQLYTARDNLIKIPNFIYYWTGLTRTLHVRGSDIEAVRDFFSVNNIWNSPYNPIQLTHFVKSLQIINEFESIITDEQTFSDIIANPPPDIGDRFCDLRERFMNGVSYNNIEFFVKNFITAAQRAAAAVAAAAAAAVAAAAAAAVAAAATAAENAIFLLNGLYNAKEALITQVGDSFGQFWTNVIMQFIDDDSIPQANFQWSNYLWNAPYSATTTDLGISATIISGLEKELGSKNPLYNNISQGGYDFFSNTLQLKLNIKTIPNEDIYLTVSDADADLVGNIEAFLTKYNFTTYDNDHNCLTDTCNYISSLYIKTIYKQYSDALMSIEGQKHEQIAKFQEQLKYSEELFTYPTNSALEIQIVNFVLAIIANDETIKGVGIERSPLITQNYKTALITRRINYGLILYAAQRVPGFSLRSFLRSYNFMATNQILTEIYDTVISISRTGNNPARAPLESRANELLAAFGSSVNRPPVEGQVIPLTGDPGSGEYYFNLITKLSKQHIRDLGRRRTAVYKKADDTFKELKNNLNTLGLQITTAIFSTGKYIQRKFSVSLNILEDHNKFLETLENAVLQAERLIITLATWNFKYYWSVFLTFAIIQARLTEEMLQGLDPLSYLFHIGDPLSKSPIRSRDLSRLILMYFPRVDAALLATYTGGKRRIKNKTVFKKKSNKSKRQSKRRVKKFKTHRKKKIESVHTKRRSKK